MDNEIQIRSASITDVIGIQTVARRTWNSTYAGIIPAEVQDRFLDNYYSLPALQESIAQGNSWFFVAAALEEIVGYAQFFMRTGEDKSGELTRIYVLPEWQGKGIGKRMLDQGVSALKQAGADCLFVTVERDNLIGRGFYEKQGFYQAREFTYELAGLELPMVEYRLDW